MVRRVAQNDPTRARAARGRSYCVQVELCPDEGNTARVIAGLRRAMAQELASRAEAGALSANLNPEESTDGSIP
jgi:hypothetical protein